MTLRVVGAGVGRTGTHSLKVALERLLGAPCYHMVEVLDDHLPMWTAAIRSQPVSFDTVLGGYSAAVDWPASAFWHELSEAFPDSLILLSKRDSQTWWRSANHTIFETFRDDPQLDDPWHAMARELLCTRFTANFVDEHAAIAAYERHVENVRRTAPKDRLLEWHPSDGWGPLCAALGLPVPNEQFPHVNTTDDFRSRRGFTAVQ